MSHATDALKWAIKVIANYYRVGDYMKTRLREYRGTPTVDYADEGLFWEDLLGSPYHEGRTRHHLQEGFIVRLREFHVTPWAPLLPGTWWTPQARNMRETTESNGHYITLYGPGRIPVIARNKPDKLAMMTGGYGNIRLKSNSRTADGFALFCATSSGHSWKGIPILVPPSLCDTFIQALADGKSLAVETLTGRLLPTPNGFNNLLSSHMSGAHLLPLLASAMDSPDLILVIESPIGVKTRRSETPVIAIAWAIFETYFPFGSLDAWDEDVPAQKNNVSVPGFTYHLFDVQSDSEYKWARNFLRGYAGYYKAHKVITEFDQYRPWHWEQPPDWKREEKLQPTHQPDRSEAVFGESLMISALNQAVEEIQATPQIASARTMPTETLRTDDGPGKPSVQRPDTSDLLRRMKRVDPDAARRYRQASPTDCLIGYAHRAPQYAELDLSALVASSFTSDELLSVLQRIHSWEIGLAQDFIRNYPYILGERAPGTFGAGE